MRSIRAQSCSDSHTRIKFRMTGWLLFSIVLVAAGVPAWSYRIFWHGLIDPHKTPFFLETLLIASIIGPFFGLMSFLLGISMPIRYIYTYGKFTSETNSNVTVTVTVHTQDGDETSAVLTDIRWIKGIEATDILYVTRRYNILGRIIDSWVDLELDKFSRQYAEAQWKKDGVISPQ